MQFKANAIIVYMREYTGLKLVTRRVFVVIILYINVGLVFYIIESQI